MALNAKKFIKLQKKIEKTLIGTYKSSKGLGQDLVVKKYSYVVNEYGDVSGLVTVEDILEEIMGEIQDEYDSEEKLIMHIDGKTTSVSGKTSLHDLNEELKTHFKVQDAQTASGLIIHLFGRIPKSG